MPLRAVLWLLLVGVAAPSAAQDARSHVRWQAVPATVSSDGRAEVRLLATIAPGWKLYALTSPPPAPGLRVTVDTVGVAIDGAARHARTPVAVFDSLLGVPVELVTGATEIVVPLRLSASPPDRVPLDVRFAVCDASICLPPRTVRVEAMLLAATSAAPEGVEAGVVEVGEAPAVLPGLLAAPRPPALRPETTAARIGPAPQAVQEGGGISEPASNRSEALRSDSAVEPEDEGGPRVPRLLLAVLAAAALVRAVLFVRRRASGAARRDDQNGAGGVLENGPRDAA